MSKVNPASKLARGNRFVSVDEVARNLIRKGRQVGRRHGLSARDTDRMIVTVAAMIGQARFPL